MKFLVLYLSVLCVSVQGATIPTRIAGGNVIQISQRPYATSLLTNGGVGNVFTQSCGGTIITNNAILSAAGCFFTNNVVNPNLWWRARVGTAMSNSGGMLHLVRVISTHPNYSLVTRIHDIAVLRTSTNIAFAAGLSAPARIAGATYTLSANEPVNAIGWGATQEGGQNSVELRQVQFFVVNQNMCAERYATLGFTLGPNMVCAGWLDAGVRGQCEGDNGSPLISMADTVVAVHSWSAECASQVHTTFPGVNTLISPYTRWVVDQATV